MSFFDWLFRIFSEYKMSFLRGTANTLLMAVTGTLIGFLIGLLIALVRTIPLPDEKHRVRRALLRGVWVILSAYVEIIRGTPMLVQALIIHYSLFVRIGMPNMLSAIIILSFNTGAYMAEIVRGGIISVDRGQTEAAHAIGMSHVRTMSLVVLPQAVRNIMPSIGNEFVVNIKDSSVLSVISIVELMFSAKQAGGAYAQFVPAYVICALIYFILTFTVTRILRFAERRMAGSDTYVICGSQSDYASMITVENPKEED